MNDTALSAILLISCPDQRGLVASVTEFLFRNGGNILSLDQHVDAAAGEFFMRVAWDMNGFALGRAQVDEAFGAIAARFRMTWALHFSDERPRIALFVSKQAHCLYEILARWQSGEWRAEVRLIVSNHDDLRPLAAQAGIAYHAFEVTSQTKTAIEQEQLALLAQERIDLIVLARYMQIVTPSFVAAYPNRIINIHHSFLPAFVGAKPYHRAHERGVKIIGATSHYVTAELDAGPIIDQDTIRVDHRDSVADLIRKGRDVEKLVLARAIWYHLDRRILVHGNKTVVFA